MRHLRNEDGIALVISLMFTLVCLGMITMLMYLVLSGTKKSGAQARYRSSLEASYGGVEFLTKTLIPRTLTGTFSNYSANLLALKTDFGPSNRLGLVVGPNLKEKMFTPTAQWDGLARKSVNPKQSPDLTFTLPGQSGGQDYKVYSKITDTVPGVGLLDASGVDFLDSGVGVAGAGSATQTPRTPNMYTIEVQGEKAVNPKEKANLTVLYAY